MKTISTLMLAAAFLLARPAFAGVDVKSDEAPKAGKAHAKSDTAKADKKDEKEDKKDEKKDDKAAKKDEKKEAKKEKGGW